MCTNYDRVRITYYFKFATATACICHSFNCKLSFCGRVLKTVTCVEFVRKGAEKIIITIFLKSFCVKKINELVATSKKLRNNLPGLVASSVGPPV
jgi:hypothetical protein